MDCTSDAGPSIARLYMLQPLNLALQRMTWLCVPKNVQKTCAQDRDRKHTALCASSQLLQQVGLQQKFAKDPESE